MELTNALRRAVASLDSARGRREEGMFKAEGTKCVADTIGSFRLRHLIATRQWADTHASTPLAGRITCLCAPRDLERMSSLKTPQGVIAVYDIPDNGVPHLVAGEPAIALDTIQDPGNLGTIIRVADWFGIRTIIASPDTADCFSPKVVQATMGGIARVKVHYTPLPEFLAGCGRPVTGTFLNGENIMAAEMPEDTVLVVGSEGTGSSQAVERLVSRRVTIPSYPPGEPTSESLNAAVAAAISVAFLRRPQLIR